MSSGRFVEEAETDTEPTGESATGSELAFAVSSASLVGAGVVTGLLFGHHPLLGLLGVVASTGAWGLFVAGRLVEDGVIEKA